MTDTYNDLLSEELGNSAWDMLKKEATSMTPTQYATTAADIAGIFDPTPCSDAAALVLSAAQGDGLGVLLSLASMIPYAGDALAKPAKIAKYAPKTAKILGSILSVGGTLVKSGGKFVKGGREALENAGVTLKKVAELRKKALDKVKQAMLDAKNKVPGNKDCEKLVGKKGEKRRLQMAGENGKNGEWVGGKQPADGNGTLKFNNEIELPDGRKVSEIDYKNGGADFENYVEGGKHDLWEVTGNAKTDGDALTNMMREKNPSWDPPDKDLYTLHHFEDGQVGYVPTVLHDRRIGGAAHTGANSMMNNKLF